MNTLKTTEFYVFFERMDFMVYELHLNIAIIFFNIVLNFGTPKGMIKITRKIPQKATRILIS